jgi:hypothetical protein
VHRTSHAEKLRRKFFEETRPRLGSSVPQRGDCGILSAPCLGAAKSTGINPDAEMELSLYISKFELGEFGMFCQVVLVRTKSNAQKKWSPYSCALTI